MAPLLAALLLAAPPAPAETVVVVTLDGFRWQELFTGADESYMDAKAGGVKQPAALKAAYLRDTPEARREALMPFFWGTVAKGGQIFGNPARRSSVRVTNGLNFSYPGYAELFCGFPDPSITSNAYKPNPNATVFEFLHDKPAFRGRVEATCTWDVFPSILRAEKAGFPVVAGWSLLGRGRPTERERGVNALIADLPRYWHDSIFDAFTAAAARVALDERKPRVLYVGLGETDEWGHGRRYDLYLGAARNADRFLAETWAKLQSDPRTKGKSAMVITSDHGRGATRADWTDHGKSVAGADRIWAAAFGAGIAPLGEREGVEATQGQIAATIAELVGEDYRAAQPKAAQALPLK